MIGRFLRSLYVGKITEYLCEEEPAAMFSMSRATVCCINFQGPLSKAP